MPTAAYTFRKRMRALIGECKSAEELVWFLQEALDLGLEVWDVDDKVAARRAYELMGKLLEARVAAMRAFGDDWRGAFFGWLRSVLQSPIEPRTKRIRRMFGANERAWGCLLSGVLTKDMDAIEKGVVEALHALNEGGDGGGVEGERGVKIWSDLPDIETSAYIFATDNKYAEDLRQWRTFAKTLPRGKRYRVVAALREKGKGMLSQDDMSLITESDESTISRWAKRCREEGLMD